MSGEAVLSPVAQPQPRQEPMGTIASMFGWLQRSNALMYKNFLLKRRSCCATLFEVLAPVAVIAILVLLRLLLESEEIGVSGFGPPNNTTSPFVQPREASGAMFLLGDYLDEYDRTLAIGPPGKEMKAFEDSLVAINPKFENKFSYFETDDEVNDFVRGSNGTYPTKINRRIEASIIFQSFAPNWAYTVGLNNSFRARRTADDNENVVRLPRYRDTDVLDLFEQGVAGFIPYIYWDAGLSTVQLYVDNFVVNQQTKGANGMPFVSYRYFPEPAHISDDFPSVIAFVMLFFGTLSMIWPVFAVAKQFAKEKEDGLAQGMFMMGLDASAYFASMLGTYAGLFAVTSVFVMLVLLDVFPQSDSFLMFLLFYMYCIACFCFAFMVQTFFTKAKSAGVFAGLIFFVSSFGGFVEPGSEAESRLMCLAPSICLSLAYEEIANYEKIGGTNPGAIGPRVTTAFWMFVVDWLLFIAVGVYFSMTRSTAYGTQLPYRFLCSPFYWKNKLRKLRENKNYGKTRTQARVSDAGLCKSLGPSTSTDFYDVPDEAMLPKRAVMLRDVCLTYNQGQGDTEIHAVKNVSLDLFNDEIHALLGHNGAGKTSLVSVLTGLQNSTGGFCKVNGYDTRYDMNTIRETMGVCTQHNTLFDDLTVIEHLRMFARLKRVDPKEAERQIADLAQDLQLANELEVRSKGLSGGFKRKLSIAIALIGDTKVVYLDEPTSGLDTYARKAVWDVLKARKKGRCMVLTTHFMDEADYLGDRITIMTHGSISCSGSSLFLKQAFGVGYTFTLTKATDATPEESTRLRELVKRRVPQADLLQEVAGQIVYRLTFEDSKKFPEMFDELETHLAPEGGAQEVKGIDGIGLDSYSIGVTTLEEVFVKVGQLAYKEGDQTRAVKTMEKGLKSTALGVSPEDVEMEALDVQAEDTEGAKEMKATMQSKIVEPEYEDFGQKGLWFRRNLRALLSKRFSASRRDIKAWVYTALLPPLVLAAGLAFSFALQAEDLTPVSMNPLDTLGGKGVDTLHYVYNVDDSSNSAVDKIDRLFKEYNKNDFVVAEELFGNTQRMLQSKLIASHSNHTYGNARLGGFGFNYGGDRSEFVTGFIDSWNGTSSPTDTARPPSLNDVPSAVTVLINTSYRDALPAYTSVLSNVVLSYYTSAKQSVGISVRALPRTESENAQVAANAAFYLGIGLAFVPANAIGFIVRERMTKSKHLQRLSGVSPIQYWLANYIWDTLCFFVSIATVLIVMGAYGLSELFDDGAFGPFFLGFLMFGMAAFPLMYCLGFLFKDASMSVNVVIFAAIVTGPILKIVTDVLILIGELNDDEALIEDAFKVEMAFRVFPTYCMADITTALITRASAIENPPGVWDLNTTGYSLLFLGVEIVFYSGLCIIIEYIVSTPQILAKFQFKVTGVGSFAHFPVDEDVQAEQTRVLENQCDDPIQVRELRKTFRAAIRNKVAVDDLTFGVQKGQIFGFLGSNGAGKTSTMKMLIGDMLSDEGHGLLAGFDTRTQQGDIRRRVGYCPQFDALIPLMTARETLTMFATFKGVKASSLEEYVSSMITILDLSNYADKPCGTYSGGNKRKLSVGMALIGNPPIVFLDEPSSGMDPQSKRFMWNLVSNTMGNRSVVLTTHSMDEAEALCSKIGIMVAGKLRCIGSAAHLKHRYGNGLQLEFSLPIANQADLQEFMDTEFSTANPSLLESRGKLVKIRIDKHTFGLSDVFRKIEAYKQTDKGEALLEYCVSETTLERIFIHFANEDPRLTGAKADGLVGPSTSEKKSRSQAISAAELKGAVPPETATVTIHGAVEAEEMAPALADEQEIIPEAEEIAPAQDV
jgi:ATP-binding cassette subfamily A (ABC1) protein 3